jgi:hypothetical protein
MVRFRVVVVRVRVVVVRVRVKARYQTLISD